MEDKLAGKTVAMKTVICKSYFPNISIWEAYSAFKLQGLVSCDGDLNSRFLCINADFLTKRISDLREGFIIPEMNWDSCYTYPKGNCVWKSLTSERFPTFQCETPLVEVAGTLV